MGIRACGVGPSGFFEVGAFYINIEQEPGKNGVLLSISQTITFIGFWCNILQVENSHLDSTTTQQMWLFSPIRMLQYAWGIAGPKPLRISQSQAVAEFSVKSFALFMWWRVYETCSQIFSKTDIYMLAPLQLQCFDPITIKGAPNK